MYQIMIAIGYLRVITKRYQIFIKIIKIQLALGQKKEMVIVEILQLLMPSNFIQENNHINNYYSVPVII